MTRNISLPQSDRRPHAAKIAAWLTLYHVYRLMALGLVLGALGVEAAALLPPGVEQVAQEWLLPAGADLIAAVTAPIIAWLLWRRRGLTVWVVALIWHALAAYDIVTGMAMSFLAPIIEGASSGQAAFLATTFAIHIVAVTLLTRHDVRQYYLSTGKEM